MVAITDRQSTSFRLLEPVPAAPAPASGAHRHDASAAALPTRTFDRRGTGHGMLQAGHVRNRWLVALRHIAMVLLGKLPGTRFKSRLLAKVFGIQMGENVGIAGSVLLDPYDPSLIRFGDNVIVGYASSIFVHAFTLDRQRVQPVTIGSNVIIGGFCTIAPGVTIGDGASIAPGTVVSRDVPAGAMALGNPMQLRKRPMARGVGQ